MEMTKSPGIKPVIWIGNTKADLTPFPEDVKDAMGYALYIASPAGSTAMRNLCAVSAARAS